MKVKGHGDYHFLITRLEIECQVVTKAKVNEYQTLCVLRHPEA